MVKFSVVTRLGRNTSWRSLRPKRKRTGRADECLQRVHACLQKDISMPDLLQDRMPTVRHGRLVGQMKAQSTAQLIRLIH